MDVFLTATIDRVEGEFVVLILSDGQEIFWPKNNINFNFSDGDLVNIYLTKNNPDSEKIKNKAELLLKNILQTNV